MYNVLIIMYNREIVCLQTLTDMTLLVQSPDTFQSRDTHAFTHMTSSARNRWRQSSVTADRNQVPSRSNGSKLDHFINCHNFGGSTCHPLGVSPGCWSRLYLKWTQLSEASNGTLPMSGHHCHLLHSRCIGALISSLFGFVVTCRMCWATPE